jgi:Icc-related predicted phosphoesterase
MRLLVFSDIHNDYRALERLASTDADYYIAAGDLTSWGRGLDRCGEILRPRAGRVWVLPGNHESADQVAAFCKQFGFENFHERSFEAGGWRVAGLGYSNPTPFDTPGEYTEDELAARLAPFAALQPLVLVCHCPPLGGALDQIRPGVHAGSAAVRRFIEERQPPYFFCGHIHEAEGASEQFGATRAVNVGRRGYLLELDAARRAPGELK